MLPVWRCQVDTDKSKEISLEEWKDFWQNVLAHGYPEDDVLEEVHATPRPRAPSPLHCGEFARLTSVSFGRRSTA